MVDVKRHLSLNWGEENVRGEVDGGEGFVAGRQAGGVSLITITFKKGYVSYIL